MVSIRMFSTILIMLLAVHAIRAEELEIPEEAYAGWKRLAKAVENVRGEMTIHEVKAPDIGSLGNASDSLTFEYWKDLGCIVAMPRDGEVTRFVVGPDEVFSTIQRDGDTHERLSLYFDDQVEDTAINLAQGIRDSMNDWISGPLNAAFTIDHEPMVNLGKNKRGISTKITSIDYDLAQGLCAVSFEYRDTSPRLIDPRLLKGSGSNWFTIKSGKIWFNFKKDWAIREYLFRSTWGERKGEITYQKFNGSYVPQRIEQRSTWTQFGQLLSHHVVELKNLEVIDPENAKLDLKSFGLTRPKKVPSVSLEEMELDIPESRRPGK